MLYGIDLIQGLLRGLCVLAADRFYAVACFVLVSLFDAPRIHV
jgi:hypothetical protein